MKLLAYYHNSILSTSRIEQNIGYTSNTKYKHWLFFFFLPSLLSFMVDYFEHIITDQDPLEFLGNSTK